MKLTSLVSVIAIGTSVLQQATPANANLLNRLFNKKKTLRRGNGSNHDDAASAIEEQHRLLQDLDGSLSMPTDNIAVAGKMDVVDTVVAKLKEQGESVDPVMLAQLPAVEAALELEESPMHYYDEHDFTEKCLKLLFIVLPDYKASKLSFICGERSTTTTTTTTTTTSTTTTCNGYCRRALREGEEAVSKDIPLERRLEIIKGMEPHGAKAEATFSFMYDLISKESCDALVKYMDSSLECDIDSGVELPVGVSSQAEEMYDSWTPFEGGVANQYNKKLYAKDIVEIIGADETMKLIDYFHESLGEDMIIDCMYLARHGDPGDQLLGTPWHKDTYATMEITLNDDYDGGEVLHLNASGVYVTDARPGSVTGETLSFVCIIQ